MFGPVGGWMVGKKLSFFPSFILHFTVYTSLGSSRVYFGLRR